jgi:signal transduction histidine kinase
MVQLLRRMSPPRLFTLLSFLLIALLVASTGLVLTNFFRQAIIDREGIIIRDFAQSIAAREVAFGDLEHFTGAKAQEHFQRGFAVLAALSDVVRVKVFNRWNELVWSDEPSLIGVQAVRGRAVQRAFEGEHTVVFYASGHRGPHDDLPDLPLVEFYVPILVASADGGPPIIAGALAMYRSAEKLNATLERGVYLVWGVTAVGGLTLYIALFALFRSVYRRQREAESRLSQLTHEHERLVQLEKLSAIGRMMGEIAHQINNPLVGVMNLAQLAEREQGNPERTRELLADIRRAGDHCRTFVQRMLAYTKIARFECQDTELQALVAETVQLFREAAGDHHVTVEAPEQPVRMCVDPTLIRHALFNLLTNAAQVNPPDGRIVLRLAPDRSGSPGRRGWSLSVIDEGTGIAEENRDQLFTPFFTTRPGGTGLGLSVCEHIAVQHGGQMSATNDPSGGACFTLWLPETSPDCGDATNDSDCR